MQTFNPDQQTAFCQKRNLDRLFQGRAPSLNVVSLAFGEDCTDSWLMIQLDNLVEYSCQRERLTPRMIAETAALIRTEFGFLKVTEFMLFMLQMKTGRYGHMYGMMDGMRICDALRQFLEYRNGQLARLEQQAREEKAAREEKEYRISYQEWKRLYGKQPTRRAGDEDE